MQLLEEVELNLEPISVNKCWQGKRFATKEYKNWTEAGLWLLKGKKPVEPPYNLEIDFYMSLMSDIDNPTKATLDLLKKAEIIKDDRYIMSLRLRKIVSKIKKIKIKFL